MPEGFCSVEVEAVGVDFVNIESSPPITMPAKVFNSGGIAFSRYASTQIATANKNPIMHWVRVTQLIVGLLDSPLPVPFISLPLTEGCLL